MEALNSRRKLYALDFDGVICDSAIETGITGWKAAHQIWPEMPSQPLAKMITAFRQVRPVMETGYEAILIMRLLFEGVSPTLLLADFSAKIAKIIAQNQLAITDLKQQFGEARDHWIANDLDEWTALNPLFDGFTEILRQIEPKQCYIITTKQERFVSKILKANNIGLPANHIFGLDRKLSKRQILTDLLTLHPDQTILFVEDRLPTLINIINDSRLQNVLLFFANWGYSTKRDKQQALNLKTVTMLDLADFISLARS